MNNEDKNDLLVSMKIGTPKPVFFRECDENYSCTDIDLEARIAMNIEITDYDSGRYDNSSGAVAAIKSDPIELFQRCMKRLPELKSVVKGFSTLIPYAMEEELSELGITAKTQLINFALTEESEKEYRDMMALERARNERNDNGWDQINPTALDAKEAEEERKAREAGQYKVKYKSFAFAGFSSEKKYYAPGENVEVKYRGIMSDTRYTFYVTAKGHKVEYDDRNFYRITFVMPEHDVDVSCGIESVMTCNNQTNNNPGLMGAMVPDPITKIKQIKQPGEWFCTECGQKNKDGKFCRNCGAKRYGV